MQCTCVQFGTFFTTPVPGYPDHTRAYQEVLKQACIRSTRVPGTWVPRLWNMVPWYPGTRVPRVSEAPGHRLPDYPTTRQPCYPGIKILVRWYTVPSVGTYRDEFRRKPALRSRSLTGYPGSPRYHAFSIFVFEFLSLLESYCPSPRFLAKWICSHTRHEATCYGRWDCAFRGGNIKKYRSWPIL